MGNERNEIKWQPRNTKKLLQPFLFVHIISQVKNSDRTVLGENYVC